MLMMRVGGGRGRLEDLDVAGIRGPAFWTQAILKLLPVCAWMCAWSGGQGVVLRGAGSWKKKRQEVDRSTGEQEAGTPSPAHQASSFLTTHAVYSSSSPSLPQQGGQRHHRELAGLTLFQPFPNTTTTTERELPRHHPIQAAMATFWSRLWDKTKKDPLVPIGCTATLGCLGAGLYAFKSGEVRGA